MPGVADGYLSALNTQSKDNCSLIGRATFAHALFRPLLLTEVADQDNTPITQGIWSFGASSIADLLARTKHATIDGVAGQIQCPCLVLKGEGDMFFVNQPQQLYDALRAPKQLFRFTSEDRADNHCQSGALAYLHEVAFNWLDETLKANNGKPG